MTEAWAQQVEAWHDFYVIVGGAAAGLTGLMFIVVSLGGTVRRAAPGVRAFVTPTVVFFSSRRPRSPPSWRSAASAGSPT